MATTAPLWKTVGVFLADPHTPCHPQANHSQSQGCRGEVPVESQHLIGDGLSDWMTEEVDFSSYLPTPHSSPSPNSSPPPSPLQNDIQVPSDLEVMTSLLQEELAQLEDYFLSEPLPEKGAKLGKCDKGPPPACPQSYYQLPYASYPTSNQSEAQPSPLLVTLATGELDLLSFCGGPIGRSKPPRPVPYSCGRPSGCARKRVPDGARLGEVFENTSWSSKGNISGSPPVTLHGSPGGGEDERAAGKGYCPGSAVEIRRCAVLPRDDKHCRFTEGIVGGGKGVGCGYGFGAPLDVPHKRDDLLMYGMREIGDIGPGGEMELLSHVKPGVDMGKAAMPWKTEGEDGYLQSAPPAYQSFLGPVNEQVKGESLQLARHHDFHCGYLEDQGSGCLPVDRDGLDLGSPNHRHLRGLKDDSCSVKSELESIPEFPQGERKQKKRDQNKTAAHRYRQRKRAELDSLEEQLHGLEGRNRELRDKAESVEREIQYVKDLLIEVYKARSQRLKQDHNG